MVLARPRPWLLVLSVSLLSSVGASANTGASCLDEHGRPVDWFLVYKFPKTVGAPEPHDTGLSYAYITSESVGQTGAEIDYDGVTDMASVEFLSSFRSQLLASLGNPAISDKRGRPKRSKKQQKSTQQVESNPNWTVSEKLLDDPSSLVLRTLAPAYDDATMSSVFYNDQPPSELELDSSGSRAHAKGVVMMDQASGTGLWLTHSTPNFPPARSSPLSFEENVTRNGQTFMCISYKLAQSGQQVIEHLINMFPQVYDSQLDDRIYRLVPNLKHLTLQGEGGRKKAANKKAGNLVQTITTRSGKEIHLFSKSSYYRQDIYADWMNKDLDSNLYVASWRSGAGGKLDSMCDPDEHRVNNVRAFKVVAGGQKITWSFRNDHSKWAISETEQSGLVCIADINRMPSQFKRGGGAVCIQCPQCWRAFSSIILEVEPCPLGRPAGRSPGSDSLEENEEDSEGSVDQMDLELVDRLKRIFL